MLMFKNKKDILLVVSLLFSITSILVALNSMFPSSQKIVYVDNMKLFDSFNMTKEMKKIGEQQFNKQKLEMDSLYLKIQKSSPENKENLTRQYIGLKQNLEQFNQNFAFEESQKIWQRLHSYIESFSSEKNYKLIIGSDKKQDVLFAHKEVDITNELISYVNSKYEGIK